MTARRSLALLDGLAMALYMSPLWFAPTRVWAERPADAVAEFRVNQHTQGVQQSASVALDALGNAVVVWQSEVDGNDEIRARRFDVYGTARGDELAVNTLRQGAQNLPAVAMAAAGDFVVVWQSLVANHFQIRARRFNAAGDAQDDEVAVSAQRGETQGAAAVAMDAKSNFVVVWESPIQGSYEIRARRYGARGEALGSEFGVNTLTVSSQRSPAVAMNAAGDFVVVWRSNISGSFEIRAQRFEASGARRGNELAVNALCAGDQLAPAVALDAQGNFVVAWENALDDRFEIRSRRFTAQGTARSEETQVSPETAGEQFAPAVAVAVNGDFRVAWHSQASDGGEVRTRAFSRSGSAREAERAVNDVHQGIQKSVALALNARGDSVLSWHGAAEQDWDIAARCYPARSPKRASPIARAR